MINYTQLALSQRAWLVQQYKLSGDKPMLVITHYPGGRWMDQVGANKRANSMYINDLPSNFFPANLLIWVSGHTHRKTRSKVTLPLGSIIFVSNPVGYPREHKGNQRTFDPGCLIEI